MHVLSFLFKVVVTSDDIEVTQSVLKVMAVSLNPKYS